MPGKHERQQVGMNELRSWAMQSRMTAEREGFPGVAESVRAWESLFNEWQKNSIVMVELRPVGVEEWKAAREAQRMIEAGSHARAQHLERG